MRIGIDARALGSNGGGDETYIRSVIRALEAVDRDNEYTIFLDVRGVASAVPSMERMRQIVVAPHNLQVRIPLTLPLAVARAQIDLLHVQYLAPPLCPVPVVVSVHDIAPERYPQFFTPAAVAQLRIIMPLMVRRAATVLTLSEFSKQDIVRRYCVPPEKVVVAPGAADPMFRPLHDTARLEGVRARYKTSERFILCVGNLQPRKNLRALIAAYVKLRRAGAISHRLVLVGRRAWLYDDTFAAARDSGYTDELVFTDYVPDEDLVALYNAADLFVYPSIFEGFGLPPLEAMACGTPVIASNTSAIPETVGDAALTVNPFDIEGLASALAMALTDAELRAQLSTRGVQRAAVFSWENTARTILNVYRGVSREQQAPRLVKQGA